MVRLLTAYLVLSAATVGCGQRSNVREIDDAPSRTSGSSTQRNNGSSQAQQSNAAIHSLKGWGVSVTFYASEELPDELLPQIEAAAGVWNEAVGWDLLRFAGKDPEASASGEGLYRSLDDDKTILYFDQEWLKSTGKPEITLATTIWEADPADPETITRADIRLNAWRYIFADVDHLNANELDDPYLYVDLSTVLIHELGHMIGLEHVSQATDEDSVMHAQTPIGAFYQKRQLSAGDINRIRSIYGTAN